MKVLVTGGAGFIGSSLVDSLLDKGHEVVVVDNLTSNDGGYLNNRSRFWYCDITDSNMLCKVFKIEKPEVVYHLAAQTMLRRSIEDPVYDGNINIIGTINVLEACRLNNVRRIIYTSTGGARVGEPEYLPVDEKHPLRPVSPYGISKHSAEHYVEAYGELYGFDYMIFCFGNVYGPRDSPQTKRLVPLFLDMIKRNETPIIFGDGDQTRDFIYVMDIVDFLVKCIDRKSEKKLFHLANGKQISINEVYSVMKKVTGFDKDAGKVAGIKGEVRDIVLDIRLARDELGWNPSTDLEDGLRKTWEWANKRV
jgi:UDP-glucose 4-epimerase